MVRNAPGLQEIEEQAAESHTGRIGTITRTGTGRGSQQFGRGWVGSTLLTWRRQDFQIRIALLPGVAEFVNESVNLVDVLGMDLQQGNAEARKDLPHQIAVTYFSAGLAGAVVLEFDGHHGKPVAFAVDEEVDVALANFKESRNVFSMKDFKEAWLALNMAALGGDVF